jgi:hypothetical protein
MGGKVASVTKERDVRIHASLWHTSECLLERGLEQERASFHQFMASLVFTAFSFEAYLNWLGTQVFPHWNYLERLSPKEKLALLSDQLKVTVDDGQRPWQTIRPLFEFRNDIAHGKPEVITTHSIEKINDHLDRTVGKIAPTEWERFCTRENAERARKDVEEILNVLHAAAHLNDGPGPLASGIQSHFATRNPNST